jgi:hypothetical protein
MDLLRERAVQIKAVPILLATVLLGLPGAAARRPNVEPTYILGKWSDACPCHIPCPCWRTSRASARVCLNVHVFRITRDESSDSNLAGLTFVVLMKPNAAYEDPSPRSLYIDSGVPTQQAAEIESLVERLFGRLQSVRAHIRFSEDHDIQRVKISGVLDYKVRTAGAGPAEEVRKYMYTWLSKPVQGVALDVRYKEPGHEPIHYSGTNSISAEFRLEKPPSALSH